MWRFLSRLRAAQLFIIVAVLFVVDLFIPDPVLFLDEILLGVMTLLLGRWKRPAD